MPGWVSVPGRSGEKMLRQDWRSELGAADTFVLLGVVYLALTTWCYLAPTLNIPVWKPYLSVSATIILALAALNRHPYRAELIRLLAGVWIMAAPIVVGFAHVAPALRGYLAVGGAIAALSVWRLFRSSVRGIDTTGSAVLSADANRS